MSQLSFVLDAPAPPTPQRVPPAMPLGPAGQLDLLADALRVCEAAIKQRCEQLDAAMRAGVAPRGAYARLRNTIHHSQHLLALAERVPSSRHVRHRGFAGAVADLRRGIEGGIATKTVWYRHVAAR